VSDYRRPGVYLEEALQTQPTFGGSAVATAAFSGVAPKGPINQATRVDSWSDYVQKFGGFDTITVDDSGTPSNIMSYLPYALFSFYQNGGRTAYIIRAVPASTGAQGLGASVDWMDGQATPAKVFTVEANGVGTWGNTVEFTVIQQTHLDNPPANTLVFGISITVNGNVVETFTNLSMTGIAGTRPVIPALNDPLAGSRYVTLVAPTTPNNNDPKVGANPLAGGVDPGTPAGSDLLGTPVTDAIRTIEGPVLASFQPFRKQDGTIVMPPPQSMSSINLDRNDIFVLWDGDPISLAGASYVSTVKTRATSIGTSETYAALYCPWVIVPDPARPGGTISVPPSGSMQGVMARVDATVGPWRTPAGMPAVLSTAVAAEVKFTDTDQGDLNYNNVNVVRAVPGSGVACMGGRTRKLYGPDRYVGARRTLIYIEDSLKTQTYFAIFENNDARLWSALRSVAQNLLNPLWERGGLAGTTASEAYYVVCDASINTPQVVQSGEVRMEVGVALQYPAEFIVIRISQFDSGQSASSLVTAI